MGRELLHAIFEERADERPGALALASGREQLTYADLERRANRIARQLRRRGVGRGCVVGLLLPRSADAYAALLGILKAGAAYVPIEPECPSGRAEFILDDSHATALVTTSELGAAHARFDGSRLALDTDRDEIESEAAARLAPSDLDSGPRHLCYVLYRSGSAGRPTCAMDTHRSACNLVRAEGGVLELHPEDRVYQGSSLACEASIEEIWLAFQAGATLVAPTPEVAASGPAFSRWLWCRGVSVLSCAPPLLATLDQDVPTLRLLILGGQSCPASLVERWARPGRRLIDTYGDGRVKIEGFRVELAEIESALAEDADVLAAACALRHDGPGGPQLIGYVVLRRGLTLDEERLRAHLRSRLPANMVPAVLEAVPDLPWLPSGNLDRDALPPPRAPLAPTLPDRTGDSRPRRVGRVLGSFFRPRTSDAQRAAGGTGEPWVERDGHPTA